MYEIAEAMRHRRGGVAVVLGSLCPRTRNAQVAIYQAREVEYLVATDAIGMGLNLDINHVAFAGLAKFDGTIGARCLPPTKWRRLPGAPDAACGDGSSAPRDDCPSWPTTVAAAWRRIASRRWSGSAGATPPRLLEPEALLDTLLARPSRAPRPSPGGGGRGRRRWLRALAPCPPCGIRRHRGAAVVQRLWEVCQIPDFRKLADDTHTKLCARVFGHIARDQHLPTDWLAAQIGALARADGDIDTLMQRLSGVRVWSYIAARSDWVQDSAHWQGKAREVEDLLSDALHERLTSRLVDRRAAHLMRRLEAGETEELLSAVTRRGEVIVEGHPVGRMGRSPLLPDPATEGDERRLVLRAARRALREEMPRRVAAAETAPDAHFTFGNNNAIVWDGEPIARLVRGTSALRPRVQMRDSEFVDGAQRERLRIRLQRFLDDRVRQDLAPLLAAPDRAATPAEFRGLLHRMTEITRFDRRRRRGRAAPPGTRRIEGDWRKGWPAQPPSAAAEASGGGDARPAVGIAA